MSFLLSTLEPTQCHFCFEKKNDVIIPVYSVSILLPRAECLEYILCIQSNGYLGLFHLFLFWNNINRTHPKLDSDFQLQTASNTTTLLVALFYCNNGVVLLTGWSYGGVPQGSGVEIAILF